MPRTRDGLGGGHNNPMFCELMSQLAIGEYLTLDLRDYWQKIDTMRAYMEQAARLLGITLRSRMQGHILYVGRFRNPLVNEMGITQAEARERVKQIKKLAGTMSNWEIADVLGIHPTNLAYIAQRHKIKLNFFRKGPRWTQDRDEALIGYVLQGKTSAAIAELLGVGVRAVEIRYSELREMRDELPPRQRGGHRHGVQWTDEQSDMMVRMWTDGTPTRDIAAALGEGFTEDSIRKRVALLRGHGQQIPARSRWSNV